MAINKITAPLSTGPSVFASPVINQLASLLDTYNKSALIIDGNITAGSLFCIGGSMFLADSDTAISGTKSNYVSITVSGDTATASYVSSLSSVSWNGSYHNYYDANGVLYLFDEGDGINDGYITKRHFVKNPFGGVTKFSSGSIPVAWYCATVSANNTAAVEGMSVLSPRYGIINISYELKREGNASYVHGQVYVDNVAKGGIESTHSTSFVTKTLSNVAVSAGSRVSVYIYCDSSSNIVFAKNLTIMADISI